MKKNLLSKTAFAAVLALSGNAAIADSIPAGSGPGKENFDLFIGGYYKFYAGWASNTGSDSDTKVKNKKFDFLSDAEIDFRFEGKTDSNLRYGAVVELLANPGGGVKSVSIDKEDARKHKVADRRTGNKKNLINADETYAYFEDSWGRVELGNTDGASDAFAYYAPNKFGTGGIDGVYEDFLGELGSDQQVAGFKPMDTGDSLKASYYTPRYAGFQAGVSYIPQPGREGRRIDFSKCLGKSDKKNLFDGRPLTKDEFTNATELAANYVNTFGDVGFAFYGAWTRANAKENRRDRYKEWQSFGLGTNVTYKGWTAGGSFVYDGRSGYARKIERTTRSQVRAYGASAGLMYEVGPWTAGMNWTYGRGAGNAAIKGHNYQHVLASGVTYQLLKGVKVDFEVVYRNKSVKKKVTEKGPARRFEAKRSHDWAVISGVKMNF